MKNRIAANYAENDTDYVYIDCFGRYSATIVFTIVIIIIETSFVFMISIITMSHIIIISIIAMLQQI